MDDSHISPNLLEAEPLITSSDPNERKLARRLRIQRRLEALRRQNEPELVDTDEVGEQNLTKIQIEKSVDVLNRLLLEGQDRVTNIRVACDSRETDRREAEGVNREKIVAALEEEAQLAEDNFNHISERWGSILRSNDPLHINDAMMEQKERCEELMRQKDGVIAMLKEEIASSEKKFGEDQKNHKDDIALLSSRIEKQICLTRRVYREQLKLIEESMEEERKILIDMSAKKWEDLHKKRDQEEEINAEKKHEQLEKLEEQLIDLRRDFQEKYRQTKINLERDIDVLERELEKIKSQALLNSEKMDYNYQILKKREDENIIIKSQQKRRINKLQDVVNTLKRRISEYTEETKQKIVKVSAEIAKLQKNILDIESKADHFAEINDAKFNQLWDMNVERVLEVVKRILKIDKILHEQVLGLEWIDKGLLKKKELLKENLPSYKEALAILQEEKIFQNPEKSVSVMKPSKPSAPLDAKKEAARDVLLGHLMKQIADRAGFILEDRLQKILEPYLETEKTLVKMDNVFSALKITKDADIDELLEYFLPFTHCPICTDQVRGAETEEVNFESKVSFESGVARFNVDDAEKPPSIMSYKIKSAENEKQVESLPPIAEPNLSNIIVNVVGTEELEETSSSEGGSFEVYETLDPLENMPPVKSGGKEQDAASAVGAQVVEEKLSCQYQHPLVISSVYVLKALRHFVSYYYKREPAIMTMSQRLSRQRNTICRLVEEEDIKAYWKQFESIFTDENENIWNALIHGLNKYYAILKDRKGLYDEVITLRQRNQELRVLLSKYIADPDNPNLTAPCSVKRYGSPSARSNKFV